jgi:hypothetical protein
METEFRKTFKEAGKLNAKLESRPNPDTKI